MCNKDWLNLVENIDNIHQETFTLSRSDIEAIHATDLELLKKDEELEDMQIAMDRLKQAIKYLVE